MHNLTAEEDKKIEELASRHQFSPSAVKTLLDAIVAGGGGMAQFSHPDLGGMGQWSRGGMIMIGDMFNQDLKQRVGQLCNDLADLAQTRSDSSSIPDTGSSHRSNAGPTAETPEVSLFVKGTDKSEQWWGADFGSPSSTGAQNNMRYAFFPETRRLAIKINDDLSIYDTGDQIITGVSQKQSRDQSLTFTSQHGLVKVADLKRIDR